MADIKKIVELEFQINNGPVQKFSGTLDEVNKKVDDLQKATSQIKDAKLSLKVDGAEQTVEQIKNVASAAEETVNSTKNLKQQYREAVAALSQFEQGTEAYNLAAARAGELKDRLEENQRAIAANKSGFDALIGGLQGAAGAFSVLQGAAGLFGSENENIQQGLLKVQSALAIVQGIDAFSESLPSLRTFVSKITESNIVLKASAATTSLTSGVFKLFGASVDTTSASFKGLRAAIASTGIGLLVVGVASLITSFDDLKAAFGGTSKAVEDFNTKQKDTQKELQKTAEEARIAAGLAINELQNAFNNVANSGGDASTVLTDIQKQLPELSSLNLQAAGSQDKVNEALNRFATLSDLQIQRQNNINAIKQNDIEQTEILKLKTEAATEADKKQFDIKFKGLTASTNSLRALNKELDLQIAKIQTQRAAEIKAIDDQKKAEAAAEEARRQAEANRKDANQKEIRATKDKNEAIRKLDEQKATQGLDLITTQFANNLSRLKEQQAEELKQANITAKARADINAKYNALIEANELQRVDAINKLNEEIKAKEAKLNEDRIQGEKDRNDKFSELNTSAAQQDLDNREKILQIQLDAIDENNAEQIQKAKELRLQLLEIEKQKAIDAETSRGTRVISDLQKQLDAELKLYEGNAEKQKEISALYDKQIEAEKQQSQENINTINEEFAGKKIKLDEETAQKSKDISKEEAEEKKKLQQQVFDKSVELANALADLASALLDVETKRIEEEYEKRLDNQQKQNDEELSNVELTNEQRAELERQNALELTAIEEEKQAKLKEIKKKQADIDLAITIANIIAQTAQAVIAVNASPAVNADVTQTLRGILTALVIGIGVAQTATAVAQRQAIQGLAMGGMVYGPGTETSDSIPAMLSNGEAVINAKAVRRFAPLLSAINESTGGAPIIPRFAAGGIVTANPGQVSVTNIQDIAAVAGQTAIRAYILESDVTSESARNARLTRQSRIK